MNWVISETVSSSAVGFHEIAVDVVDEVAVASVVPVTVVVGPGHSRVRPHEFVSDALDQLGVVLSRVDEIDSASIFAIPFREYGSKLFSNDVAKSLLDGPNVAVQGTVIG